MMGRAACKQRAVVRRVSRCVCGGPVGLETVQAIREHRHNDWQDVRSLAACELPFPSCY